jgi:hypothetical protein
LRRNGGNMNEVPVPRNAVPALPGWMQIFR